MEKEREYTKHFEPEHNIDYNDSITEVYSDQVSQAKQVLYRWVKASEKPLRYEVVNIGRLILYGKENGANIVNGMPWSFNYKGYPVTHETDKCYLVGVEGVKCTETDEVLLFNGMAYSTWGFKVKVHILYDGTPRILTFGENRWCFYREGLGSAIRVKDLWDTNENEWAKIEYLERVDNITQIDE
jgi:hypothetical protein